MIRSVKGEVVSSTFDEPFCSTSLVSEMVISKAKRLVEHKRKKVILLNFYNKISQEVFTQVLSSFKF